VAASWQSTGADVVIKTAAGIAPGSTAVRQIATVPGVRQATAVWATAWETSAGQAVTLLGVDPASYAALTAGTPFPSFPGGQLTAASGSVSTAVPVIASPSAVAALGGTMARLFSAAAMGPVTVRVAGTLSATPALPGGGGFAIMAVRTLPGSDGRPAPNLVLVNGSGINQARLAAVVRQALPGSTITYRAAVLAQLAGSPLQHGDALIITLTIAAAAAFGLFIVLAGLALGSAQRELTLARLVVMGYERAVRLVLAEAMPSVLAAVAAGAACAVVLPRLLGSALDLSGFTGTNVSVQLQPDLAALALPALVLILIAAFMLVTETRALRRRGVTGTLRIT